MLVFKLMAVLLAGAAPGTQGGGEEARYWRHADRLAGRLDRTWDEGWGAYRLGSGGFETTGNANLLVLHSVAALRGHAGAARRDARARSIVRELLETPPYVTTPSSRGQAHAPGWTVSMRDAPSYQHMAVDSEVMDGLAFAWRAREPLGLDAGLRRLLRRRVTAVALSRYWRWPSTTANQINWPACVASAFAAVTGDASLLRRDLRLHIRRFVAGARPTPGRAGNLGPGLRFHYIPHAPLHHPKNVDSAEYASIVASFTRFLDGALERGMANLGPTERRLLGAWLRRVLAGYWTHAGYLNWDTGYGLERWHQIHKFGLAQQALIGIASAPQLASPDARAWATWMLERGFEFHARQSSAAPDGVTRGTLFGLRSRQPGNGLPRLGAARLAGNAARAIDAGLGAMTPRRPPPLYAFDPDTGRLAVTTRHYNTAVVPVSQGAYGYGGIDLARLYDGHQEPAATIGARVPAAFGLRVRDPRRRTVLATQRPRRSLGGPPPLRLTRGPSGVGVSPRTTARRAHAGPFRDLRALGRVRGPHARATVTHRFTARYVESRWTVRRTDGAPLTAEVLFPSRGRSAVVLAVREGDVRQRVTRTAHRHAGLAYVHIRSARSGYVLVLRGTASPDLRLVRARPQRTEPDPGPTLAVRLAEGERFGRRTLAVRLAPVLRGGDPAAVAAAIAAHPAPAR